MAIITLDKLHLAFGHHVLLDNISSGIDAGEKIGLIGRNGAGKSSLLKVIAGVIKPDDGRVLIPTGTKVVYVAQEPQLNPENSIFTEICLGLGTINDHAIEYYQILEDMNHGATLADDVLDRFSHLQEEMDKHGGWAIQSTVERMVTELGLNADMLIKNLSGGLKKKVALAKALVSEPDILLLDEPTNHLDIYVIEWLEVVIKNFRGTILMVTHDRMFLDHTVNKIIELDRGQVHDYPGSYAKYCEWKESQIANEDKINHEFDKFLAQEEVWIRKGIEARRTRNEGRVKRLEQLRETRANRRDRVGQVSISIDKGNSSGKIVAELNNVSLSFADKVIIQDFTTRVMRGDKIGLIGPNGIGKSTLLKIILGELSPDSGKVQLGTKIEVAYFDQLREELDETKTIQDVVSQGEDYVMINGRKLHIATYLEEFLFEPARFRSPVKSLSGGERNRLLLARLFSRPANVLVFDEPTNDLDIDTLELLEQVLSEYAGTVFLVSHDRSFLDNIVSQSYVFMGEGKILELVGGYTDWLEYKDKYITNKPQSQFSTPKAAMVTPGKQSKDTVKTKLSYKEKLELDKLPQEIEALEQEQSTLQAMLLDSELYKKEAEQMQERSVRLREIENAIVAKLERWEELDQKS